MNEGSERELKPGRPAGAGVKELGLYYTLTRQHELAPMVAQTPS